MGRARPQKRFLEIIQSLMLRSQSSSRASPSGGIHLMVGPTACMRSRQSMRMNHSSTGRKTSSDLQRQQCGYTCGYFSRATRNPEALSAATMSSATSLALRPVNGPNPSMKTALSSSGAMNGMPLSLPNSWSSAPQPGAMWTRPVPSASLMAFQAMTRCAAAAVAPPPGSP